MKKVRLKVAEGHTDPQSFLLFSSPEALYMWLKDESDDPSPHLKEADEVIIVPGEFIECEWRGCEFSYEGNTHQRLDYVRLAKASQSANASGLIVSIHYGWTIEEELPFSECDDEGLDVHRITADERQLDLTVLFKDEEDDDEG